MDTRRAARDTDPDPPLFERVLQKLHATGRWIAHRTEYAHRWIRAQDLRAAPTPLLVALLVAVIVGAVTALWLAMLLLHAIFAGIVGGVFGNTETAAPTRAPESPPAWMVDVRNAGLWERLYTALHTYADQNAAAAGMPTWLLIATWLSVGVVLLVATWLPGRRSAATAAGAAWLTATCWVIWINTPGMSPVPAAIGAALAACASLAPWSAIPVAALVLVGVLA